MSIDHRYFQNAQKLSIGRVVTYDKKVKQQGSDLLERTWEMRVL